MFVSRAQSRISTDEMTQTTRLCLTCGYFSPAKGCSQRCEMPVLGLGDGCATVLSIPQVPAPCRF